MNDPITFEASSPRFALPFLFSGQAQKEAFVNEALARADALMHCAIEGEASTPPSAAGNGECWLVAAGASGEWTGMEGQLACRQSGNWIFVQPQDGLRVLDRSTGQDLRFVSIWQKAAPIAEPFGGSNVDNEARTAIASVIAALRVVGVLPAP